MWYLQSVCSGLLWFSWSGYMGISSLHHFVKLSRGQSVSYPVDTRGSIIECKYCPLCSIHKWDSGYKKCYLHMRHRNVEVFTFPPFINICLIYFTNSYTICYQYTVFYTYSQSNVQPYFSVHKIYIVMLLWYLIESGCFSVIGKISFSPH